MNTDATVVSSSRPEQRTIPPYGNSASTAESDDAIAPVCDDAALLPASVVPAFIAAILHPLRDQRRGVMEQLIRIWYSFDIYQFYGGAFLRIIVKVPVFKHFLNTCLGAVSYRENT